MRFAEVENLLFQPADRPRLHIGHDDEVRWLAIGHFDLLLRAEASWLSGFCCLFRGSRLALEQRCERGVFAGRAELVFAITRDHGMVRQPVLGMEALHLFETVGAVDATTHTHCPGFGHGQSA